MKAPEKHRISRPYGRAISWFILIIVGMSIVPPILFGEPRQFEGAAGGDPWRNLLYDFQTMIGGLLAISAAVATIHQMQNTDWESERRHKELVKLSLRTDALKIERLLFPQYHQLQSALPFISKMTIDTIMPNDDETALEKYRFYWREISNPTWYIRDILDRPIWAEAAPLFGGGLTYDVRELEMRVRNVESSMQSIREALFNLEEMEAGKKPNYFTADEDGFRPMTQDELLEGIRGDWFIACENVAFIGLELPRVIEGLTELAATYEISLSNHG